MKFRTTTLPGVIVVEPEKAADERGHFAREYSRREFSANGIGVEFVVSASSHNPRAGTLRGLHYQARPFAEAKLVSCTRGLAYDVVVDLRPDSRSFGKWFAVDLSAENGALIYVPQGCAHGFQTLAPDTVIHYQISAEYRPGLARGVRWDDPTLAIDWPYGEPTCISARDAALPLLVQQWPSAASRRRIAEAFG